MIQSLTALDVLTILGTLILYDVLKWYAREWNKGRKEKGKQNDLHT